MYKIFTLFLLLFFIGCSSHQKIVKPNEKAFAAEDGYILFALRAEQLRDYKTAAKLFNILYAKSLKKEYLYRFLEDKLKAKEYNDVIKKVNLLNGTSHADNYLTRLKIVALINLNKLDEAQKLALKLAQKSKKAKDYLLVSDIYTKRKNFELALKYLEGAYVKNYNEKLLDKMAIILYFNLNRKKEAIADLESHARIQGCSKLICNRLISFYSRENNVDGLLSVYKRLYSKEKSEAIAKKIIQIYAYKREYVQLMNFLEENPVDNDLLLELYVSGKNYFKASQLAFKLYNESGDIHYLGESAIYKYEALTKNSKKISKKDLKDIIMKMKRVIASNHDTLYLNYLGYILIDHDIDVKKGMHYIREVLKQEPDSGYYLDSLAWGYYKLHNCQKAKTIMQRVSTLKGGEEPEVLEHIKKIDKCILEMKKEGKTK
jgi:hypothetical protein